MSCKEVEVLASDTWVQVLTPPCTTNSVTLKLSNLFVPVSLSVK